MKRNKTLPRWSPSTKPGNPFFIFGTFFEVSLGFVPVASGPLDEPPVIRA